MGGADDGGRFVAVGRLRFAGLLALHRDLLPGRECNMKAAISRMREKVAPRM